MKRWGLAGSMAGSPASAAVAGVVILAGSRASPSEISIVMPALSACGHKSSMIGRQCDNFDA
jgi:hypothetical protein